MDFSKSPKKPAAVNLFKELELQVILIRVTVLETNGGRYKTSSCCATANIFDIVSILVGLACFYAELPTTQ